MASRPNPPKINNAVGSNFYGLTSNAYIKLIEPIGANGGDRGPFTVYLPYVPDEIPITRSAEYKKTPIPFGTENTLFYERTSPINFSLDWTYVAGVNIQDGVMLMSTTQLLHSMVLPGNQTQEGGIFSNAEFERPGVVWVVIGEWLKLRCVIEDVKLNYKGPWGSPRNDRDPSQVENYGNSPLMPKECDCNISFEVTQFYDAHKGTTQPNKVQSLPEAARRVGARSLRNREYVRNRGLSNINFAGMVD